jgi:uncharacterized RDD family membrane protein YckC
MVDAGPGRDGRPAPAPGRSGWIIPADVPEGPAPGYVFVGFWRRFCAYVIDMVVLAIPSYALFLLVAVGPLANATMRLFDPPTRFIRDPATGLLVPNTVTPVPADAALEDFFRWIALAILLMLALQLLYFALFWSRRGGTPGQLLLGVEIRNEVDGSRIGFVRACLRFLGYVVCSWILYVGFVWVVFDARKQGWHDKMAGTVAVRRVDRTRGGAGGAAPR